MKEYLVFSSALFFYVLPLPSCNNQSAQKAAKATPAADVRNDSVSLKNIILTEQTVIAEQKLIARPIISTAGMSSLFVKKIDSANGVGYTYHMYDTLFINSDTKILLLARAYVEENVIWLASYFNNMLVDYREVYYDNAEGFLKIQSAIQNNLIKITMHNDLAENKKDTVMTETFVIDPAKKIIKK